MELAKFLVVDAVISGILATDKPMSEVPRPPWVYSLVFTDLQIPESVQSILTMGLPVIYYGNMKKSVKKLRKRYQYNHQYDDAEGIQQLPYIGDCAPLTAISIHSHPNLI